MLTVGEADPGAFAVGIDVALMNRSFGGGF
jgi:hypothetical protein